MHEGFLTESCNLSSRTSAKHADPGSILVICGPTASGKSDHALSIPNADIINGDSLQVYADLHVLTARPDPSLSHHYLYGFLPPHEQMNVMTWRDQVAVRIQQSYKDGRTPVLVGGTGFYLDVLVNGIAYIPPIPEDVLVHVRSMSIEDLRAEAEKLDTRILVRFFDRQRIQRAVAVQLGTGKSLFDWHNTPKDRLPYQFDVQHISVERSILYERIHKRFEQMIEQGAIEEVARLKKTYPSILTYPIARAIGFKEISDYIDGLITKAQMIELGQQKTRQYAKRQMTWFKRFCHPMA